MGECARITISMPEELLNSLRKRKAEEGIPISTQIRRALEKEWNIASEPIKA